MATTAAATITTSAWNSGTRCWETIEREPAGDLTSLDDVELTAEDFGGVAGRVYRVALLDADGNELQAREIVAGPVHPVVQVAYNPESDAWRVEVGVIDVNGNMDADGVIETASGEESEAHRLAWRVVEERGLSRAAGDLLPEVLAAAGDLTGAKTRRDAAVRAAFDAGIDRQVIATAAGFKDRQRVYQIAQGKLSGPGSNKEEVTR